jgi:vacuolar-type H+-ATPase subunit I/STV1
VARPLQVLVAFALLAAGLLAALYGLFAIWYEGDGGGDTYVMVGDRDFDADVVRAVAITLGLAALLLGLLLMRRRSGS